MEKIVPKKLKKYRENILFVIFFNICLWITFTCVKISDGKLVKLKNSSDQVLGTHDSLLENFKQNQSQKSKNFQASGHILNWNQNSGHEDDEWLFIYDATGYLILHKTLVFDENSLCQINNEQTLCDPQKLINSSEVKLEAQQINGKAIVRRLEILN